MSQAAAPVGGAALACSPGTSAFGRVVGAAG